MANGNQTQQPLNYQQRNDLEFLLNMLGESGQPTGKIPTNQPIDKLEIPNLSLQDFKKLFEKADDEWFLGYEGAVSDKLKELYPHLVTVPFAPGRDIVAVKNPETQEVREFNLGGINLKTQEGLNKMQSIYEEIAAFVGSTSEEFKNTTEGKIYELTGIHNEEDYGELKEDTKGAFDAIISERGIEPTITGDKLNADQQLDLSYKIISKLKDVIKDPSIGIPNFGKDLTNIESYEFSPDEINEAQNYVYREIIKIPEYKNLTKESFEKIMKHEQLFRATQAKARDEIEREKHHISMKEYYKDGELDDSILNDKILNEFILAKSDNSVKVEWDKIPETPLGNIEGDGKEYNMRTAIKTIAANSTRLEEMYEDLRDLQEDPEANSKKIQELTNGIDKLNEVDNKVRNLIGKENLEKYIGDYFNTTGYTDEMIKKYNEFQGTVSSLVEEQISNNPQWSPRDALKALLTFNVTEAEILDSRANEKKFTFNLTDDITEQTFKKILLARTGVRYGEGLRQLIKNTFDGDEGRIDGDTATLSYSDLNKMGLDYRDFNNWSDQLSHLVSEEDVNWMRVHSYAKSENDVERSVLFNQSILNKSVLSYEKPEGFGLFTNAGASAIKTIATEWFGINPLDADKLGSAPISYARGEDDKIHHTGRFLIDKTQEAIAKYNSVNSEKIKNGTLQAIELSDKEIEYVARADGELYSDQIGAFLPIVAQIAAISYATEGIGTIPQIAKQLRAWRALSKKSMFAKASWHVGAGILEEAKMQLAGFKPGAGISFYGIGLAASPLKLSRLIPMKSSFVKTLDPAFETFFKTGPIGAVAMKTAGVTEAMIDAWYFKDSDLDTSLDEMFGNHEDLIQQSILDVLTFKTIGVAKYASPFSGAGKIRQELIYPFYNSQRMNKLIKQMRTERDGVFEEYEKYGKDGKKFEDLSRAEQIELIANRFNLEVGVGEGGIPKGKKLHDIDPNTQRPYGWKLLNRKQKTIWETKNDIAYHAKMFKFTKDLYKKLQPPKDWNKATEAEKKEFKDNVNKLYFDPMKRILKEYGRRGNLKGKDLKSWDFNVEFTTDRMKFQKVNGKDLKNTAEFDPATNTMRFDPNLYTPGKPIHEFLHKALSSYLNADGNQLVKANFHGSLMKLFEGQDFRMIGGEADGLLISDLILNTYKEGGKKLDLRKTKDRQTFNEEYFAHIIEQMANPEFYYKHTAPTIIRELKQDFRSMMEEGIFGGRLKWKYNPPTRAKHLVQLMGRLSYGLSQGRTVDVKLKTLTELDKISLLDVELNKSPKGKSRKGSIDLSTGYKQASEKLTKEYKEYGLDNMKKDSKEKQKMSEVLSLDWEIAIQNKIKRMLPNSSRIDVERIANQFITSSSWGTGKRGLPDLINEYNKDKGYGIEKWIGSKYGDRLKEHTKNQVFTKSIDVEPVSGRPMSETLAGGEPTPTDVKTTTTLKPKSNLLTANLTKNNKKLVGNKKKGIIKNSILDLTPKEIPGLIEGISKPAPKPILKLVNEITGKNVQENKDFVNENFKESKAVLPPFNNGIGGKSIGVPPSMLKAFYKLMEGTAAGGTKHRGAGDKSGDTAGNPWQELNIADITKKKMFDFFKFDKKPGETGYTTGRTRFTAFKKFLAKKILTQELEMMEKNRELPPEISNELTKNNIIAEIVSTNQKRLGSRDLTIAALEMKMEKDPTDWVRKLAKLTQGTAGNRKLLSREVMKVLDMEWGETAKELTDQQKLREEVKAVAEIQAIAKRLGIDARTSLYSEINKDPDLQIERKKFDLDILRNFAKESGFSFGALTKNARSIIAITLGANARTRTERINGVDVKLRSSDVKEGSIYWQSKEAKEIFSEKDITKQEREQALKDYGAVYRIDYQNVRKKVSDFIKQQDKSTKSIGEKNIELKDFVRDLMTSKRNLKPGTPAIKNADGTIKVDEVKPRRYTVEETLAANKLLAKRWILSVYKAAQKGNRLGYALAHQGMQTDIRDGIFKALAYPLRSVANRGSKPTKKNKYQEYHWEHERQLLNNTNLITGAMKTHLKDKTSAKFEAELDQILETSHQSLIPKDLQMKNDKSGKTTFSDLYGKDGKITINDNSLYNVFLNAKDANAQVILHGEYAGRTIYEMVTSEAPNSLQHKVLKKILKDKGKKLDVTVYDKLQEIISEGKVKTVNKKLANKLDGIFASKDLSNVELTDLIRKRAEAIAKMRDLNAKHKGASVLDFDETVALTKSTVKYEIPRRFPDGRFNPAVVGWGAIPAKGKLTPAEFAKRSEQLEKYGAKFDFSEFYKVVGGKKGPLFKKLQKIQEKYGTENTFILTARPQEAAPAIRRFLKELGVDIPLKNIIGLESGAPGAKANFFIEKTAEGYNDFYFADDMLKNVNAVKKTLKILGVDGKVRQAKIQASKDLSGEFNKMLEETTGVKAFKVFSTGAAKSRGGEIGKWKWWLPPSAEGFLDLMYPTFGKGKTGNAHMKWFDQKLGRPYARGFYELNKAKQRVSDDMEALKKRYPDIKKIMNKNSGYNHFTNDAAVRVYLWNKHKFDIPDLSKADVKQLVKLVKSNPRLESYANQISKITQLKEGYVKPTENWLAKSIQHDLIEVSENVGRKQFFKEWIENKNQIFTKENLNKLESQFGTEYRKALEDVLYRMENGQNKIRNATAAETWFSKWIANATGTVMFLNRRSALTQTISMVNFLNWKDNNPLAAARAFINQPRFWKDFSMIWNSPMLKQRRKGLSMDVNYAEIVNTVSGKKDKVSAAVAYMLNKGFVLTKVADNFAIAFGGASFYRNRLNSYLKQGMKEVEAKKKAFLDFQEASEPTQQSSRPDLISQQQASPLGRFLLTFQNVTMQNNRNGKRAFLDLKNNRGDFKTNISKMVYYFGVQNAIFLGMQQALFAAYWDDDADETDITKKHLKIGNGMIDTLLRGSGMVGVGLSTLKNTLLKYMEESEKGWKGSEAKVLIEALNVSPPVGSKARKLHSAMLDAKFNKDSALKPVLLATEGVTNVPFHEFYEMVQDGVHLSNKNLEDWQRVAIALGYPEWQVNYKPPKKKEKKQPKLTYTIAPY